MSTTANTPQNMKPEPAGEQDLQRWLLRDEIEDYHAGTLAWEDLTVAAQLAIREHGA